MSEKYELDERAQILFRQLIQSYTKDGQPVGSKSLAQQSGIDVSSATIRNIMHNLEKLGLVDSPHTSAGRVPTQAGYRFFIDSLLEVRDLGKSAEQTLSDTFSVDKTSNDLIQSATGILSQMTQLTGLISVSRPARVNVRHIEFMKLTERRILVIMVVNSDQVHNKVIQVDRDYTDLELTEAEKLLSRYLIGSGFNAAKKKLQQELKQHKDDVNNIMNSVLDVMGSVCENENTHDSLLTAGESNLLQFAELSDINKLRDIFDTFNQKRDLLHILDGCSDTEGVQIFIGSESGYKVLSDCTVIGAPYSLGDDVVGVLGVIGPTRIAYDKVIPAVDLTARLLSSALNTQK
ncbi:MAG: heat-inducible transcription repressor HrcA [Gammaproteobacteria bacterium]|nr:heat-inducible transcription repressor HrcA [Gammaproteobacteria bacterium]